jgi:hypothetical protein
MVRFTSADHVRSGMLVAASHAGIALRAWESQ